jgi:single-strand DNA-binding protein
MSKSINRVTLLGHVGSDPDVKNVSGGRKVANVNLATNSEWTDDRGKKHEDVQWHRCTFWEKSAEIVEEWLRTGDRLFVEGRIKYDRVENSKGEVRYYTSIIVSNFVMLGGGKTKTHPTDRRPSKEQFVPRELGDRNPDPDYGEDLPF